MRFRLSLMVLVIPLLAGSALPLAGQTAADSAAIRAVALDYIQGWYAADAPRMERSLHPDLAKRLVPAGSGGRGGEVQHMTAAQLVEMTREGGGRDTPAPQRRDDVRILDIFAHTASVRVDADGWIDYMHLGRVGGEWKIINVLWAFRPRP
jgi:hypothetical protein